VYIFLKNHLPLYEFSPQMLCMFACNLWSFYSPKLEKEMNFWLKMKNLLFVVISYVLSQFLKIYTPVTTDHLLLFTPLKKVLRMREYF